jgi:hypothetical protein
VREMGIDQIQSLHRSIHRHLQAALAPTFVIYLARLPTARFCASCELSGVDSFQKQKRLDVFACADLSFASRSEKERTKPQQWIN